MCVGVSGFLSSFLCVSSRHVSPFWSSLTDSYSPNLLGLLLSKRRTLSFLFNVRWCSRRQNFPSFSALKLFIGKSLPFLFTPIWICAPRFTTVQKQSDRTFVSCGQRLDLLHQHAPVEPARGRGYDGGGRFLHSKRCPGGHSSKNGRFVRKNSDLWSCPCPNGRPFASKVHSKYRRTGASFSKAQQEFSQEVMTNRTVQTVAADAASSAAQGVFGRSRGN